MTLKKTTDGRDPETGRFVSGNNGARQAEGLSQQAQRGFSVTHQFARMNKERT
jgi:hypothetical protein